MRIYSRECEYFGVLFGAKALLWTWRCSGKIHRIGKPARVTIVYSPDGDEATTGADYYVDGIRYDQRGDYRVAVEEFL